MTDHEHGLSAAPFAQALSITPLVRNAGGTYASDLAREIREQRRGQTVLVVGHSNTTVSVMKAFGADMPKIEESEFDNLYVLTDVDGASPKVVALRYGAVAR